MLLKRLHCFIEAFNGCLAGDNRAEVNRCAVVAALEGSACLVQVTVNRYCAVALAGKRESSLVICRDHCVAKHKVDCGLVGPLGFDECRGETDHPFPFWNSERLRV